MRRPLLVVLFIVWNCGTAVRGEDHAPANLDSKYIGSKNCIECHKDQYRTYLETSHSKSMERVDPDKEDIGAFRHKPSGNDYEVVRRDDKLIHREIIRGANDEQLATTEQNIVYTIGSGAHGKSYVYQNGLFFGQSPLSWYEDSKQWSMSPGYDSPHHAGFGRKLSSECFFCHVGSIDRKAGNPSDFNILEVTIGCERCHGPGELHATARRNDPTVHGSDETIVNPEKLSRELSEAVCQQCHLQAAGKSIRAGKEEWDFRPGLPLTDVRVDYQYRLGDDTMRIVGHVEQLHMSKCYQQTESLTCITCHDPHHTPASGDTIEHYRSICLSCHDQDACGEPLDQRLSLAQNDCSQCHMPEKDTEVPHTAFRHHRIGIHRQTGGGEEPVVGLTSVLDTSNLSASERARCEALAKFQVAQEAPDNPNFQSYGVESAKALIQLKNQNRADADANTILAMLARLQGQPTIAKDLATEVIGMEAEPTRAKIEAMRLLAQLAYQGRDFVGAVKYYREVIQYQSEPHDYFQLGVAEQNSGSTPQALEALKTAIALAPNYVEAHRVLSAILRSQGNGKEAAEHAELATQHQQRMEQLWKKLQR